MKFKLDYYENFDKSLLFWMAKFVKYKLTTLSNKELKNPEILTKVQNALNSPKNITELSNLVKTARNAGLTGVNTYYNPLKKLYEILISYGFDSLKDIDEEILSEALASATGGLSDASKKNYRIAVLNFFDFIDRQNGENGASHNFGIVLKNWGGISGNRADKLPEFMNEAEINAFL